MADSLPLRPSADLAARKRRRALPLLVDARRLAKLLSMGLRTIRTLDAAGKLPRPCKISGRVLWSVAEIKAWIHENCPDREAWEHRRNAVSKR